MPTDLSFTQTYPASPGQVFALFSERSFVDGRLAAAGGPDASVVDLGVDDMAVTIVTRQSIPSAALPSMVASMMAGDPITERTEKWTSDGDGYRAEFSVIVKGAPASLKGTMTLQPAPAGCELQVIGKATVPIPMFGGKIESVIIEQVESILTAEQAYTTKALAG